MTDTKKIDKLIERAVSVKENSPRVALETLERALMLAREAGYEKGEGAILLNLGRVHIIMSNYKESIKNLLRAKTIFEKLNDKISLADTSGAIGMCYCYLGNYSDGLKYLQGSLVVAEELNNNITTAKVLNNLGNCYYAMDDFESAKKYYLKSLPLKEKVNDLKGLGACYTNLALISTAFQNYPEANEYINKAIEIKKNFTETFKDEASLAFAKTSLALIKRDEKNYTEALRIFDEVLDTYLRQNNLLMLCETYASIAITYLRINDTTNALKALNAGSQFIKDVNASRLTDEFKRLYSKVEEMKK